MGHSSELRRDGSLAMSTSSSRTAIALVKDCRFSGDVGVSNFWSSRRDREVNAEVGRVLLRICTRPKKVSGLLVLTLT